MQNSEVEKHKPVPVGVHVGAPLLRRPDRAAGRWAVRRSTTSGNNQRASSDNAAAATKAALATWPGKRLRCKLPGYSPAKLATAVPTCMHASTYETRMYVCMCCKFMQYSYVQHTSGYIDIWSQWLPYCNLLWVAFIPSIDCHMTICYMLYSSHHYK